PGPTSPSRSGGPGPRASPPTSAARRRASAGWRPRGDGRYRVYIFSDELVEVLDGAADRMVGRPREALAVRLGARIERRADVHGHRQARSGEDTRPEMRDEPGVVRPVRATVTVADRHRDDRDAEAVEQSEEPRVKGPRQPLGAGLAFGEHDDAAGCQAPREPARRPDAATRIVALDEHR